ncbi:hypothetical protein MCAP1_001768 [Malassezia caprae]|uniref:Armadillo-like helical domain-containing protein n=1 Tax=Malassezia caprae TaxID=1381934 RepID=A0AAF0IVC7_9BASI|nr:hypothetical protein MCAP1_001768 [Malassezia caprae]
MTELRFRACYERLLAGEHPWDADEAPSTRASEKANAAPRARFLRDLLTLDVEHHVVQALFRDLEPTDLLDDRFARRRDNITGLWKEALRCWDEEPHDEARSCHAVETLLALAHALLPKPYTNYTLDVVTLLAGRMAEADDVFYTLVAAIDRTLRDAPLSAWHTRRFRATLRLALVFTACAGTSSLATYLLHRDLFSAAMSIVHGQTAADLLCEASLLTALLATAGHAQASLGVDPVSSAVIGDAGFQPYQRRVRACAASPDMARMAQAWSVQARRIVEVYQAGALAPSAPTRNAWSWSWLSASPAPAPPTLVLPPPSITLLLALWLWVQVSETMALALLAPPAGEPLAVTFFSMASYLLTHAASSARATTYAHTALQIMLALLGPTDHEPSRVQTQLLADESPLLARVQLCRDRADPLPLPPASGAGRPRRLVVLVLDEAALFLKYNRRKRLDAAAFRTALACVQRTLLLCAQQRVRLEYDWLTLWRAVLGTAEFLAARQADVPDDLPQLAHALLDTLALALVLSDHVLPTPADTHWLIYELARTRAQLECLGALANSSSWALLAEVLQCLDTHLAQGRERTGFSLFRRSASSAPVSMATVLSAIQALDLGTLLAPDKPSCAAIVRRAHAKAARAPPGLPSPSAALLRAVQQDVLASC